GAHATLAALVDTTRREARLERGDDVAGEPDGTRREELADEEVTVAIDDHARQPIALAVDDPVGGEVVREHRPSERQGLAGTGRNERATDRPVVGGQPGDPDRAPGVGVARGDEPAIRREDADRLARLGAVEADGDGAREDPRMSRANGHLTTRLEG